MSDKNQFDATSLTFEQVVERLRAIVVKLEQGNLPLDKALSQFEEGVSLFQRGNQLLSEVEKKLEVLSREDGETKKKNLPLNELFDTDK